MIQRLKSVRNWVFDLDNTLYPAECDLFAQIDERMVAFIADFLQVDAREARRVQKQYYLEHGTTLNGLMTDHGMKPDEYLRYVHDIDHSVLSPNPELTAAIAALPGRKIVFTNASRGHAEGVLRALDMQDVFDEIIGIEATGFIPKPNRAAYEHLVEACDIDPEQSVFFEDLARNLLPAHEMGFATVLVRSDVYWGREPEALRPGHHDETHTHVHFAVDCLPSFLKSLTQEGNPT